MHVPGSGVRTYPTLRSCHRTLSSGGDSDKLAGGFLSGKGLRVLARDVVNTNFTLLYVIKGRCWFTCHGVRHELPPGALALRLPGVPHTVERDPDVEILEFFLVCPRALFDALIELGTIPADTTVVTPGLNQALLDRMSAWVQLLQDDDPVHPDRAIAGAHLLLVELLAGARLGMAGGLTGAMAHACRILAESVDRPVSMPGVAKAVGLGYESFRKQFRAQVGVSPKGYHIRRRIEKAQDLLMLNQYSIKETALALGYADVTAFHRQFRQVTGRSPATFRALH